MPEVANPLLKRAKTGMKKIEKALYSISAFIMTTRTSVPSGCSPFCMKVYFIEIIDNIDKL